MIIDGGWRTVLHSILLLYLFACVGSSHLRIRLDLFLFFPLSFPSLVLQINLHVHTWEMKSVAWDPPD